MRIGSNLSALTAFNSLTRVNNQIDKTIQQLSTGLRINSAADDAAGLAISENLRAQSAGIDRALRNSQDGISLIQTAEGALGETNAMLQRMRELAVQAANDTLTSQDRSYIQMEIDELKASIDRIANTTEFNGRSILDGSVCGTVTSTDPAVKGYIRGALETEGNFRIEVKANPGEAQVQKSSIMRVKHENVATNKNVNTDSGVGGVKIGGLPAGNYSVTATKIGGGQTITEYTSTTTIDVETENTSGVPETLLFRMTGKTTDGKSVSWPYSWTSYDERINNNYAKSLTIPAGAKKADIIALVKTELDGKTKSLASNSQGMDATAFTFEVDDDGNVTAKSTEGQLTEIQFLPQSSNNVKPGSITSREIDNDFTYTASIAGTISLKEGTTTTAASTITFTVSENGSVIGTPHEVNIPAGSTVSDIAALIKAVKVDSLGLSAKSVGDDQYSITTAPGHKNESLQLKATITGDPNITLSKDASDTVVTVNNYTMEHKGTASFSSGEPRTSGEEKFTLRLYDDEISGIYGDVGTITFAPATKDADGNYTGGDYSGKKLAEKIVNLVKANPSVKLNGEDVLLKAEQNGASYTITTSNSSNKVKLKFVSSTENLPDATTKVPNASFTVSDDGGKSVPGSVASLTGFYGDQSTAQTLSSNITTYVDCTKSENNASILFSITGLHTDEVTGKRTVTFSAASNVLTSTGENKTFTKSISLSDDFNKAEIGSLLGEDDSHLTISLPDLDRFNAGDKFVLSVSGSGKGSNAADTSLYINGTQDSSWPYDWSGDYVTYNNNDLYYNVNAQAVSNRDVSIRNFYLDSDNGRVHEGNITLSLKSDFGDKAQNFPDAPSEGKTRKDTGETNIAQFTANYVGKVAEGDTKLRDLEQFWDKSGVFMLEQPQVITISQNDGRKASITLNATDTLNDVRQKLNDAISYGLGQGVYVQGGNADKIVTFVEEADGAGLETVNGTFMIRSLIPGSAGELTFSSDNGKLVDALGLNTVIDALEGGYTVSVYNAHDNSVIARNVKTDGNILNGIIDKNVDVEFAPMAGINATWSEAAKNFILTPENEAYSATVHLVRNNITFQTGANEGQEITLDIGNMSSSSLGISGINVMTHGRASEAITTIDAALRRVSSQRSKLGTYQNSLEHTMESLITENEGMIAADSRIRDADMSKSMLDLVKFRIINQSSTAMLAQANQIPRSVLNLIQQ